MKAPAPYRSWLDVLIYGLFVLVSLMIVAGVVLALVGL